MDNSTSTPLMNQIRKLTYLLCALAISSCIIRNDYNVVFGFLILGIVNKFYLDNPKYYSKILFHVSTGLIIVDAIWLIITLPYWNSTSENHNEYWESLSTVHTIAIILSFVEIGVKGLISFLLFNDYKKQFAVKDLLNFNYEAHPEILGK